MTDKVRDKVRIEISPDSSGLSGNLDSYHRSMAVFRRASQFLEEAGVKYGIDTRSAPEDTGIKTKTG